MKKLVLLGLATALTSISLTAAADVKPFEAIEYRQGIFKAFKWNFGPMGEMVKGKTEFNAEEFNKRADRMVELGSMPWEAFIPGTYASSTSALPKIETEQEAYSEKIENFQKAIVNLAAAAKSGEMKNIGPAFGQAGKSCKSCHDQFKD